MFITTQICIVLLFILIFSAQALRQSRKQLGEAGLGAGRAAGGGAREGPGGQGVEGSDWTTQIGSRLGIWMKEKPGLEMPEEWRGKRMEAQSVP